jgi:hypothetical protein
MNKYFGLALLLISLLTACTKENELFKTASPGDYFPLQTGKYITYNLDSTVFISFGTRDTVIKYQVKDSVETKITDNLGRPAYRIVRYIRKNASQAWSPSNTFMATATGTTIEFIENNLRFVKLISPVKEDVTWNGNTYLTIDPYPSYAFSSDFMGGWEYTYKNVNSRITVGTFNLDSTITVTEIDYTFANPQIAGTQYAEKTYSIEKYAKRIGLVYKEFLHWEYQGNTKSYKGFGVKLTMIDHN